MLEPIEVGPCSSKCAATGRPFRQGERVISTLVRNGAELRRLDFSEEAWQGPTSNVVAWWRTTVPVKPGGQGARPKPTTLLEVFEGLISTDAQQDLAYILGLLLLRRRVLKFEGERTGPGGSRRLVLSHPKSGKIFEIPVVSPAADRQQTVEDAVRSLLRLRVEPPEQAEDTGAADCQGKSAP